jgi:DNA-binding MarR family transcriptional regulator
MDNQIELLIKFREFKQTTGSEDFALFGEWLKVKTMNDDQTLVTDEPEVNKEGLDVKAAYLVARLTSYVETWVKLSYDELPIVSLGDYGILMSVQYGNNPSKKEIYSQMVMERTTCNESINRLIKAGLLSETTDATDRRVKRVSLTPDGLALSQQLYRKMVNLSHLLMGNLSDTELKSLIQICLKLNGFHNHLYTQNERAKVKKAYNL